jgi:hypothetical protein
METGSDFSPNLNAGDGVVGKGDHIAGFERASYSCREHAARRICLAVVGIDIAGRKYEGAQQDAALAFLDRSLRA